MLKLLFSKIVYTFDKKYIFLIYQTHLVFSQISNSLGQLSFACLQHFENNENFDLIIKIFLKVKKLHFIKTCLV